MTGPGSGPDRQLPAVVFDLFGTLIDAPTPEQRSSASRMIGSMASVPADVVERVLTGSWAERHDGRLPTLTSLTAFLWQRFGKNAPVPDNLSDLLFQQATERLAASASVLDTLGTLRLNGARIAVLSDATADIAEAWQRCQLRDFVDCAVFSCLAGAVKPHPDLYQTVLDRLGVLPQHALYCGDGGGDELRGASDAGLAALRVDRRGGPSALAFGYRPWPGPRISSVEELPGLVLTDRPQR